MPFYIGFQSLTGGVTVPLRLPVPTPDNGGVHPVQPDLRDIKLRNGPMDTRISPNDWSEKERGGLSKW